MSNSLIAVGAIAGSFGVKGEVRLKSFCVNPKDIETYSPLTAENSQTYEVKIVKLVKDTLVAKLSNVTNKEQMFIFISARSRRQRRVRFGSKDVFKHEAATAPNRSMIRMRVISHLYASCLRVASE